MEQPDRARITNLVNTTPDRAAVAGELLPLVYDTLRDLAARHLRRERPDHLLQPTALVHEVFMRLVDQTRVSWQGRTHFLAVAAQAMRRVLIDHARGRKRLRRGGGRPVVALDDEHAVPAVSEDDVLVIHDALDELARLDPRQAQVVELRFFAGMTVEEVAAELGLSKRTVEDDWTHAKAWLRVRFAHEDPA